MSFLPSLQTVLQVFHTYTCPYHFQFPLVPDAHLINDKTITLQNTLMHSSHNSLNDDIFLKPKV